MDLIFPIVSEKSIDELVTNALTSQHSKEVFSHFITLNNPLFNSSSFEDARRAVNERSAVYDAIVSNWFKSLVERVGYKNPIACIAHGGFGRKEMTPLSDVDVAFLFEDPIIGKKFEEELQIEIERNLEHKESPFFEKHGFNIHHELFSLEDVADHDKFNAPMVNSFCDGRILFDQGDFASKFVKGVMKNRRVFSHLDYIVGEWRKLIAETKYGLDNLDSFNIKEDMGGLRHFQLGLRIPHIGSAEALTALYPSMHSQNQEVIDAYDFLLKIRGFVHLRRNWKLEESELTKQEIIDSDTLNYGDYLAIGNMFGAEVQKKLLESRRAIANYADIEIVKMLKKGYTHQGLTYGSQGIFTSDSKDKIDALPAEERQRKLFSLLDVVQTQALPIDLVELIDRFGESSSWINFSEDFAKLFYRSGQFPRTLEILNRMGCYNNCIPGAEELEVSVPKGGHRGQFLTSTAFGRQKVADYYSKLSESGLYDPPKGRFKFKEAASQISLEDRVAILLAYQTARIPKVLGLSSEEYFSFVKSKFNDGFTDRTLETAAFLVNQRNLLYTAANNELNSRITVNDVANSVGDMEKLNVLRAYTEIDNARKPENRHLWPIIDELYLKVCNEISARNGSSINEKNDLIRELYSDEQLIVLDELGDEVLEGIYRSLALKWLPNFVKVKKSGKPFIELPRTYDGDELHICFKDFPGLLRLICGSCYESSLDIPQVHAYTLPSSGLVFDIFHLGNIPKNFSKAEWTSSLSSIITGEKELRANPDKILDSLDFRWSLDDCRDDDLLRLTFETEEHRLGYLFALTSGLYSSVGANIYAAKSSRENGDKFRVFFKSAIKSYDEVRDNISRYFESKR